MLKRPEALECHEYYFLYIDEVPEGDVLEILQSELRTTRALLAGVSTEREDHRYAPGKWSVKEVIGHLIDAEHVFAYRALHFARCDPAPLPSMEQDGWARRSNAAGRTLNEIADEFAALRASVIAMFRGFDDDIWTRRGTASGREFTVRSIPYIIAGHELHHRRVLEERYLI